MGILSFPFRLDPTGRAATVQVGSDVEVNEAIAVLVSTMIGERLMVPEFGIPDPAFSGISQSDVQVGLDQFGPAGIIVHSLDVIPRTETRSEADIRWTRKGDEDGSRDGLV
jgi:hypothetical protein